MIKVFPNIEELNNFAAEKFVEIANQSIKKRRRFTVALAGGSTPKSLYWLLAGDKFRDKIDWSRAFFFFGDERNVSPTDAESNYRMAHESLFEPLKIIETNVFRWETELNNAQETAENYHELLRFFFNATIYPPAVPTVSGLPRFDLILLGMGADGHTASLFPFTEAIRTRSDSDELKQQPEKIAVANYVEKLETTRLTLTFSVINNARNVIFLVAGKEKAETLQKVLEGKFEPEKFPSQNIKPKDGELYWLIDKNVAKLLKNDGN